MGKSRKTPGPPDAELVAEGARLIGAALAEDVGSGDLTSEVCLPKGLAAAASVVARQTGVTAGLWLLSMVYRELDEGVRVELAAADGESVSPGQTLAEVTGRAGSLLAGERTVLNFLQRLSGIATLTAAFIEAVQGTRAVICDTRKTTPGWRRLEKYAVRCGGGTNHRMGLYDEVLIKDNHLALAGKGIAQTVTQARDRAGSKIKIEVEVDTLEQLRGVLALPVDRILLDNMSPEQLRQAVAMRDAAPRQQAPLLEASGGVTLASVRQIAASGVDRISVGALTHSASALDIGMDMAARPAEGEGS